MDSTHFLGMDLKSDEPGWGYVFGQQPDTGYVNRLAKKGFLTNDTLFNFQNQASYNQILTIAAQIQPMRDLNITVNVSKSFGKNYTELYKDTTGNGSFARLNPYTAGSFSISFISVKTLFESNSANQISSTFQTFENYRYIISASLGNKILIPAGQQTADGYAKGYGKYAQDVLIPAFIAAYSGKSRTRLRWYRKTIRISNSILFPDIFRNQTGDSPIMACPYSRAWKKYLPTSVYRMGIPAH